MTVPNGTYLRTVQVKNRRIARYPNAQRQAPGATSIVQRTFGCLVRRHSLCCKCNRRGAGLRGETPIDNRSESTSRIGTFVFTNSFPPTGHPNERCSIEVAPDIGPEIVLAHSF